MKPQFPLSRWLPAKGLLKAYIAIRAVKAFGLVAIALTSLFSLLELVEQLTSVGQGHYHIATALQFVTLTVPRRLLQVAPVSMLLGSLLSLSAMARSSELTAMQSLGASEIDIVRPMLQMIVPITALLFLVAQFVVPHCELLADMQRSDALAFAASPPPVASLWAASDHQYLNVQRFGVDNTPIGIDIYSFGLDGSATSIIHAQSATAARDGTWLLSNVSLKQVVEWQLKTSHLASLNWKSFISPKQLRFLSLPLDSIPPVALFSHLRELKRLHVRAPRFEHEFWTKVSIPLSMIAMILATSRLVFGPARTHSILADLSWGIGFGLVFSLSQEILESLGILVNIPAALCSLALPLLVIVYSLLRLNALRTPGLTQAFVWVAARAPSKKVA